MCLTAGKEGDVSNWHASENLTAEISAPRARGAFEGMANVVRFNWPLYAAGASIAVAAVLGAILIPMPMWLRVILFCGAGGAVYLLAASLIVSHVIYDRSPLYRFEWARRWAGESPRRIANIHSGFDESSEALRAAFPDAHLQILELHDPTRMTEPSIARAQRYQERIAPAWLGQMTTRVTPEALPLGDESIDVGFAILAAHEVRIAEDRRKIFTEISRVLAIGGRFILVEHLRNTANFAVFGPQFVHFYSRRTWLTLAKGAGLNLIHEDRITPFIGLFAFEKSKAGKP
jgi:SAM-dependent methyltransferase